MAVPIRVPGQVELLQPQQILERSCPVTVGALRLQSFDRQWLDGAGLTSVWQLMELLAVLGSVVYPNSA
jgi:hypothetical protein